MDMWKMLEINATTDITVIKKAYAKKLKVHHPEDDPTGFQSLKEAYDSAVQYAKHMNNKAHSLNENNIFETGQENQYDSALPGSSVNLSLPTCVDMPYDNTFVNYIYRILRRPFPLSYSFVHNMNEPQLKRYVKLKELLYGYLEEKDLKAAQQTLDDIKKLYRDDPDLIRMEGILLYRTANYKQALEFFSRALVINPGDWESYFYRARLYYMNNRCADALIDLDKVLSPFPNYFDALLLTAKCHLNQRDPLEAQKWLSRAMSINPEDKEIRDLWVTINKKEFICSPNFYRRNENLFCPSIRLFFANLLL